MLIEGKLAVMYNENAWKQVGYNIKLLRTQRRIKQMELAAQLGISQTHLSNLEKGRSQISLQNLVRCANILQCKLDDFFVMPEDSSTAADGGKEAPQATYTLAEIQQLLQLLHR